MEWEDLARKQKGKKSKSYCVSNSTLKSVAEYCSEKKKKSHTGMDKQVWHLQDT